MHINKYSLSYKNGNRHFLKGNVSIIAVKVIDNIKNIYGRVVDGPNTYFTHIKIIESGKESYICNCEFYKEQIVNIPCEHIIATMLKYNETYGYQFENSVVNDAKITLVIGESFNKDYKFDVHLYLDGKGRVRIDNTEQLEHYINNFNDNLKLYKLLKSTNFKIKDEDIKKLFIYSSNIDISLKIGYMKYECTVKKERIPLKFTVKEYDNKIRIQTIKKPIKAINTNKSVYLYNNIIYIPDAAWSKAYVSVYNVLHEKYYVYIKKSSLEKVIKLLRQLGEVTLTSEINEILAEAENLKLLFQEKEGNILAKFDVPENKAYLLNTNKAKKAQEILYLNKFTNNNEEYRFLGEDKDIFSLLKSDINNYCDISGVDIISAKDIKGNLKYDKDSINFDLAIKDNYKWQEAIAAYDAKEAFYRLSSNKFLDFTDPDVKALMKLLSFINYNGESIKLDSGYDEIVKKTCPFIDIIEANNIEEKTRDIDISGLKAKLREYQKQGVYYLQDKKDKGLFAILADEMGLGKTIQTISFILNNSDDKTLIIAPTSLIYNWKAEFEKFAPSLYVMCLHGNNRRDYLENLQDYNVIITSYTTLNMDIDYYKKVSFDNLIIDEAQNIKNPKAVVTKNVKTIIAKTKFALTGTPIENNYLELWSIFDYLKKGYLFTEKEFKQKFLSSEENIEYLKLMIKPFILRRTKKQVLKELPDKIQNVCYVNMTSPQERYYKTKLIQFAKEAKEMNNDITIFSLLTKLRQIALDPCLIDENYKGGSGKIVSAVNIVKSSLKENKKVIIFSQFTSMLKRLQDKFASSKIKYFYLDGKTNPKERINLCEEFNKSEDIKVFLISLKAGGTGLNLTSAQVVIHFDPWWNPQVENQATDRAHRIGQKNELEVIKMISKDTIEEKMLHLKEEKNYIFNNLLGDEKLANVNYSKLTQKEIEYLLSF